MLNKYVTTKEAVIALVLVLFLGTSAVVKADDDVEGMVKVVNLMDSFFGLMDSIYEMNSNNEKAALLQMHAIEDIYKDQGKPKEAVAVYKKVLKKSSNATIRNIAYSRMADVLKEAGDMDGAIDVLNDALEETLDKTR